MVDPPHGVAERAREELRKYAGVSAYLYVCFAAILFYRWAIQGDEAVRAVHWGTAAAKALVLGKFLLIGEAVHAGERLASRTRLRRLAWRTVALAALLVALTVVEDIVVAWFHGTAIAQALGELGERPRAELAAEAWLVVLILVPLVTVEELAKALGPGALARLLRSPAQGTDQRPPGGTPADRSR
jgi:hypothetical protein